MFATDKDDWSLLREYVEHGSESAFEALVRRHLDMVYSAAWRQTGDADLGEEVAQAVFLLLARKARQLRPEVLIAGWLYRTACLTALRSLRDQTRRRQKERELAQMKPADSEHETWTRLMPHLDSALGALPDQDRTAIVLRFLEQQSFREVAAALRVSEDAAKKRVNRALEKLQGAFSRHGLTLGMSAMVAALSAKAVLAAPANLLSLAVRAGLTDGKASGTSVQALAAEMGDALSVQSIEQVDLGRGIPSCGRARILRPLNRALNWSGALAAATLLLLMMGALTWLLPKAGSSNGSGPKLSEQGKGTSRPAGQPLRRPRTARSTVPALGPAILLHVMADESGQPLTGVLVYVEFTIIPRSVPATFLTDPEGLARVVLPSESVDSVRVWLWAPGRVPTTVLWAGKPSVDPFPSEYTLRLPRGRRLAGIVVDEAGSPVSAATLHLQGEGLPWNSREFADYEGLSGLSETNRPTPVVTDANGRWSADFFSPTAKSVFGYVEHPEYATTQFGHVQPPDPIEPSTNIVLVLKHGAAVHGTVRDPEGRSIAEAWVGLGDPLGLPFRSTKTDPSGAFEFPRVDDHETVLRVEAKGFRPIHDLSVPGRSRTNLEIVLQPIPLMAPAGNSIIRGRVTSEGGDPIARAEVGLVPGQPGLEEYHWGSMTDENGRFNWTSAPSHPVKLVIRGSVWDWEERIVELVPDGGEALITLKPAAKVHIHGAVWDKSTGNFVPRFKVLWAPGSKRGYVVNTSLLTESRDGTFAVDMLPMNVAGFSPPGTRARLDFQAQGYVNKVVLLSSPETNDLELTVELEPAVDISGIVVQPDGNPAEGARVSFRGEHLRFVFWPELFTAKLSQDYPFATDTRAGADGFFHIPKIDGVARLDVVHPTGWASVPPESGPKSVIRLEPWGRIKGLLRSDEVSLPGVEIQAKNANLDLAQLQFNQVTKTDAKGRFAFAYVPGERAIISVNTTRHEPDPAFPSREIEVQPDGTATVTLSPRAP